MKQLKMWEKDILERWICGKSLLGQSNFWEAEIEYRMSKEVAVDRANKIVERFIYIGE